MANNLPEGFTLDEQPPPDLPAGFTLNTPTPSPEVFDKGAAPLVGFGATPDKYQQAAIEERNRLLAKGAPLPEGYTRRAMAGPLLGWGDEIGAAMMTPFEMARQGTWSPAEGYRYAKAREDLANQAAAQKTGLLGDVAEGVGGLTLLPSNIFGRQVAAALGGGGKGVLPAVARMTGFGLESGALGAVQGAGNAKTMGEMGNEALMGGVLSGALGAPFGAFGNVARRSTAVVPSEAELMTKGARDYRTRSRLPLSYDLEKVQAQLGTIEQRIASGYGLKAEPTVRAVSGEAARMQPVIDAARSANAANPATGAQTAVPRGQYSGVPNYTTPTTSAERLSDIRGNIWEKGAGAGDVPTNNRAAASAAKQFDRILTRPDPYFLAPGSTMRDAVAAAELTNRGRGNFGAAYRSKAIGEQVKRALDDAASANSGLNFENRLRANIKSASRKDEFQGFSPAEKAAVEEFIRGTARDNLIREVGNRMAGGGGWGSTVLTGGMVGGGAAGAYATGQDPLQGAIAGLALGSSGRAIRAYGNRRMQNKVEAFQETLRQRSPEYQSRFAVAPTEIGPGLSSPVAGARQLLTLGGGGDVRNSIADALYYQATGKRDRPRVLIDTTGWGR